MGVRTSWLGALAVAAAVGAVPPPTADARPARTIDAALPEECEFSPVPASRSVAGVTDAGQRVSLDVHVLLDGIPLAAARETMAAAATSYAPLKVDLRVTRYRAVRIAADGSISGRPTGELGRMMDAAMDLTGGVRPKGSDVVLLLTDKALWIPGPNGQPQYGFSGQADCLGGVRWPHRAYAVAVGYSGRPGRTLHGAAVTASHEIGHLLGAEHHHANCVEGPPPQVCTVMLAADYEPVDVNSLRFGTVEGAVVRGFAVDHARP